MSSAFADGAEVEPEGLGLRDILFFQVIRSTISTKWAF